MSGISAIYFLDRKGRVIIFRNYRGEVNQDISEGFTDQVLELDESNMKPAFTIDNVHYIWIKHQKRVNLRIAKPQKRVSEIMKRKIYSKLQEWKKESNGTSLRLYSNT